jgi:hypothetical protein
VRRGRGSTRRSEAKRSEARWRKHEAEGKCEAEEEARGGGGSVRQRSKCEAVDEALGRGETRGGAIKHEQSQQGGAWARCRGKW